MARTSRKLGFAALVAAIVLVLVLVPTRELSDDPAPIATNAEPSAVASKPTSPELVTEPELANESAARRAAATSAEPKLTLRIVSFDGSPRTDVTVVVTKDEHALAHADTDEQGRVSFASFDGAAEVYVVSDAHAVLSRAQLTLGAGEHELALPELLTLRGRVLVDEQVPARSLHLEFMGKAEQGPSRFAPKFVCEELGWPRETHGPWIEVDTDGAGRFRVDGLHPSWRGRVKPEPMFLPQNGGERSFTSVTDVRSELVIRLTSYSVVTGRIVTEKTREPVPGAKGQFERDCPQDQTWDEVSCDDDGRFWLRLRCKPVTKLSFTFAVDGVGRVSRELVDVPAEGLDLGDLSLSQAFDVRIRAEDPHGMPIVSAVAAVFLSGSVLIESEPSKADGLCTLAAVPPTGHELHVVAFGYFEAIVSIDPATAGKAEPLVVVMEPMPTLAISARAAQGGLLLGLVARVRTWDPEPFVTKSGRTKWTEDVHVDGANGSSRQSRDRAENGEPAIDARLRMTDAGVVRIAGFQPRDRTRVAVEDGVGTELGARELTPGELEDGEVVEFVVDRMLRTLELEIVDTHGKPVRGAFVYGVPRQSSLAATRADGRATLRSIGTDRIDLRIVAQGFATTTLRGVALDAPVVSSRIVLEPATTLRVVAVDPRGRAVAAEQLIVRHGSDHVGRVTRCDGEPCFVVEDLGTDSVELVLSIGGRRFTKMHDPQAGTAKIEVPDHGGLRVEFEPWLAPPAMYRMKIQDEQGPTTLFQNVVPEQRMEFVNVPVLFPGSYTVELSEIDAAGGDVKHVVARAEHVVILANEWSMVRLAKP